MADDRLSERVEVAQGRYMTTEEVMALYHVTRRTVYRWNEAGKITGVKAGRRLMFDRREIEAIAAVDAIRAGDAPYVTAFGDGGAVSVDIPFADGGGEVLNGSMSDNCE